MHNRLKLLRKKFLNLTQEEFAKQLGISQNFLSTIERGESKISSELCLSLSKINVNLNWLLTGKGNVFNSSFSENVPDPNGNLSAALKLLSGLPEEQQKDCFNFIWDKKLISDLKNEVDELRSRIEKLENG